MKKSIISSNLFFVGCIMLLFGGFLFLLFSGISIVSSQDLSGVESSLDEGFSKLEKTTDKIGSFEEGEKWGYLGEEWRKIMLQNSFVSAADSFFKKISVVFLVLFGEPYSMSAGLFFLIAFWIYALIYFSEIMGLSGMFSPLTSKIIAFGMTIAAAQTGAFKRIIGWLGWIIFSQKASWVRFFIFIAIVIFLFFIYRFTSLVREALEAEKEEFEKEQEKINRSFLKSFVDAIMRGMKE